GLKRSRSRGESSRSSTGRVPKRLRSRSTADTAAQRVSGRGGVEVVRLPELELLERGRVVDRHIELAGGRRLLEALILGNRLVVDRLERQLLGAPARERGDRGQGELGANGHRKAPRHGVNSSGSSPFARWRANHSRVMFSCTTRISRRDA